MYLEDWKFQSTHSGVPQGSILGPLLFIDFPDILKFLTPTIFADDTTLMSYGKDIELLARQVNEDLVVVSDWFQINKLTLNIKKTHLERKSIELINTLKFLLNKSLNNLKMNLSLA